MKLQFFVPLLLFMLLVVAPPRAGAQFSQLSLPWHAMACETIGNDTLIVSLLGSVPVEHCSWCSTEQTHVMLATMVGYIITDTISYLGDFYSSPLMSEQYFYDANLIPLRDGKVAWSISGNWPPLLYSGGFEFYTLHPMARVGCSSDTDWVYTYPNSGFEVETGMLCDDCTLKSSSEFDSLGSGSRSFVSKRAGKGILEWNSRYEVVHCDGTVRQLALPSATSGTPGYCNDSTIMAIDRDVLAWTTDEGESWHKSPLLGTRSTDTILAAHRYADGTLQAVIAGESTSSTIALLHPGTLEWEQYVVPSNAHVRGRYFQRVSIVGSSLSEGIVSVGFSMYVWDPFMSVSGDWVPPKATENIAVHRGQSIPVGNVDEDAVLMDLCGRTIGPLLPMNGTLPTSDLEPGLYIMMVDALHRTTVLILP